MKAKISVNPTVKEVLSERGSRYGKFAGQAILSQTLKNTMRLSDNWSKLSPHQIEALDMIQHKIARILNGDPNYDDSWRDIAGYATLIERNLNGEDI